MTHGVDLSDRQDLANERTRLSDDNARRIAKITSSGKEDAHAGAVEKARLGEIYHEFPRSLSNDLFNALGQIWSREEVDLTTYHNDGKG
jgi:hypothetical protein